MGWSIFRSKTFWAGVVIGTGQILSDHSPQGVMMGVGTAMAAAGVRDAIYKSGEESKTS